MHGPQGYLITGTDTGVGKTLATCALLHTARRQGLRALGMKPVAAGTDSLGHNEDVEAILGAGSVPAARELVNPYCFQAAIAPHIAAAEEARPIGLEPILAAFGQLAAQADRVLVEGVGGFLVPLGPGLDPGDLARRLGLPVILVVGLRLGCLNHALLTAEAIAHRGLHLAGWVANRIDPAMDRWEENREALRSRLGTPLLGTLPYAPDAAPDQLAGLLTLP
jgi:dethiobiotin synthetase